ncbi:MAG: TetR/AcrR family transcriptional regulator [Actinomycetales bacterium]|nr:MAG: TetR/AcrR family transcriptional regulator [Actinomycetales bacterium]
MAPPPERRSARARSAVLDAALSLVTEVPYGRLTMESIAARAGVSKATLYRWWSSKGAVVVEALAEQNRSDMAYGLPDSGDLAADLAAVLRAIVDELADPAHDALLRALSVETLLDADLRAQVLNTIFTPQLDAFAARFATARSAGRIGADADDLEAMELVVAPIFHRWQQGTAPLTHAYADAVAARAVRALEVRDP